MINQGADRLAGVLEGVGDPTHERLCLNAAALIHSRVLTEAEIDAANLRDACATDPAGTPLRILWERGECFVLSTRPCERGGVRLVHYNGIKIPQARECGECEPCIARERLWERSEDARIVDPSCV